MKEFWLENGFYFIYICGITLFIFIFSLHYYTGSLKKLVLIINDIKKGGTPRNEVLNFNKFSDYQNLDSHRMSTFTHLFYLIPKKTKSPSLFENKYFLDQLNEVKIYRKIYTIILILVLIDIIFILAMTYLFGDNIK